MLLLIVVLTSFKLYCNCYKLINNNVFTANYRLNNKLDVRLNPNDLDFEYLSNLHNEAFEHPEFQLHIPPVSTFQPKINYNLTNLDTLNRLINNSKPSDDSSNDTESTELADSFIDNILDQKARSDDNSDGKDDLDSDNNLGLHVDANLLNRDFKISDINELDATDKDYIDGPLDVIKMANDGKLLEYRYMYNNTNQNNTNSNLNKKLTKSHLVDSDGKQDATLIQKNQSNTKLVDKLENKILSYKNEIPPDVFILNYSIVDLGFREYIYTSCKVLNNLGLFNVSDGSNTQVVKKINKADSKHNKSVSNSVSKDKIDELFDSVFDNKIPNWLSLSFYYSLPYVNNGFSDYIHLAYNFIRNYRNSSYHLDPQSLNDVDSMEFIRSNLENIEHWKSNGLYDDLSKSFMDKDLYQLFMDERNKLKRNNIKLYNSLVKYKNHSNVSYNISLTQLINYYANVIKMPIYIISNVENKDEVVSRLRLFGVKPNPLIKVLELNTKNNNNINNTNSIIENLLNKLNINKLIPVHYFDNSIVNLNSLLNDPSMNNLRLYFTDWGNASTYDHKLMALYSDRLKYIKHTKSLIEFVCKFNNVSSREWTHGYRLRYPDEEKLEFLYSWKKLYSSPNPI